jgi:archaellum component FlaC
MPTTKKDNKIKIDIKKVPKKDKSPTIEKRLTNIEDVVADLLKDGGNLDICNANIQSAWDKLEAIEDKLNRVAGRLGL